MCASLLAPWVVCITVMSGDAPRASDGEPRAGEAPAPVTSSCLPSVACYATRSRERHYSAGYVGGGSQFHGCGRTRDAGTWGRDYCGWLVPNRPWLKWTYGRRNQGGTGAYKSDGPKLIEH